MRWSRTTPAGAFYLVALALLLSLAALTQTDANQSPQTQAVQPSAPMQPAPPAPPLVLLDAAHGGSESGALLNPAIPEKDITLVFARRLRQELASRGIASAIIRDNDATLSIDQRAAIVNTSHPGLYISIHASSMGTGLRIFSAMVSPGDNRGPFVNLQSAQVSVESRSQWVQQQVTASIQKTGFPVRSLQARLRPLNNVLVPAVAIEIAPTTDGVSQLASTDYQQMVCAALANAISGVAPTLRTRSGTP